MVDRAFERGVDYVDVAPTYGDAEPLLGAALESRRDRCFLAGKTNKRTAAEAGPELASSLGRLRTGRLDLYQLHALRTREDVETAFGAGGAIETLRQAREAGTVRFLGFSAHSVEAALAAMDRFAFDTVMFPVNHALWSAGFGPQVVARAADQGIGVLALKSMARGRWPEGAERSGPTWYEPQADPGQMRLSAAFSLSKGAASLLPPGDPGLFWPAVDACAAPAEEMPAAAGRGESSRPRPAPAIPCSATRPGPEGPLDERRRRPGGVPAGPWRDLGLHPLRPRPQRDLRRLRPRRPAGGGHPQRADRGLCRRGLGAAQRPRRGVRRQLRGGPRQRPHRGGERPLRRRADAADHRRRAPGHRRPGAFPGLRPGGPGEPGLQVRASPGPRRPRARDRPRGPGRGRRRPPRPRAPHLPHGRADRGCPRRPGHVPRRRRGPAAVAVAGDPAPGGADAGGQPATR